MDRVGASRCYYSAAMATERLSRWPVWVLGGLVIVLCALVSASRSVPVFLLPSQVAQQNEGGSLGQQPHENNWDYWTGPGVPVQMAEGVGVLAVAAFAVLVVVFALLAIRGIRFRRRERAAAAPELVRPDHTFDQVTAAAATDEVVTEAIVRLGTAARLDQVIIDCWQAVLQTGADAGLPRTDTETSTEYVDRLADALGVQPDPVHVLAWLYREARFSDHRLADDARSQAVDALHRLQGDLSRLRVLR